MTVTEVNVVGMIGMILETSKEGSSWEKLCKIKSYELL